MARGVNVRVQGLDQLKAKLAALPGQIETGGRVAIVESTQAVKQDARRDVPRRTGRLHDAIDAEMEDDLNGAVGVDPATADYGEFVEFGTSKMAAQPFMTPAAELERARLPERVRRNVKATIGA